MIFSYLPYFLPICWSIISTIVALFLYKTSSALYESSEKTEGKQKTFRIVGSIVIAAVVFVGLWKATPVLSVGVVVPENSIAELIQANNQVDHAWHNFAACSAIALISQCGSQSQAMDQAIGQLRNRAAVLKKD